ncbi:MAG TPA: WD40 repeat domain-containing protein, partial [Pirellulales bacterium]
GESTGQPAAARSLWDVTSGTPRPLPQMSVSGYSPDGKILAAFESDFAGETSRVDLIDVETAAVSRSFRMSKPANHRIYHLDFSPNGNSLLGLLGVPDGAVDWRLGLWDFATGRALATLDQDRYQEGVFSPGGEILANANFQRKGPAKIYLFDTRERKLRHAIMLDEHGYAYRPVFSPDGKWIAIGTQRYVEGMRTIDPDCPQARIHLIDVSTGIIRETLVAPCGPISLAFHPSGTMLASSGYGFVHLWNLKDPPIGDGIGN